MNLRIEQRIAPIILVPQRLLTPTMKEVVTDTASGGAWGKRIMRKVSWTGVYGSTPGDIRNAVSVENTPFPVLIGIVSTSPP